jgi:hypothetical protein
MAGYAGNSSTTCLSLSQNPVPNRESGEPHAEMLDSPQNVGRIE